MASKRKLSLEDLDALLQRIMAVADQPLPGMEFDPAELDVDIDELYSRLPPPSFKSPTTDVPAPPMSGTQLICIRVPARVIHAFKVQAVKTGGNYQTIMNRALNAAAKGFV